MVLRELSLHRTVEQFHFGICERRERSIDGDGSLGYFCIGRNHAGRETGCGSQDSLPNPGLPGFWKAVDAEEGQAWLAVLSLRGALFLYSPPRAQGEEIVLSLYCLNLFFLRCGEPQP